MKLRAYLCRRFAWMLDNVNRSGILRKNCIPAVDLQHKFLDLARILRIGIIHVDLLLQRLVPVEPPLGELARDVLEPRAKGRKTLASRIPAPAIVEALINA